MFLLNQLVDLTKEREREKERLEYKDTLTVRAQKLEVTNRFLLKKKNDFEVNGGKALNVFEKKKKKKKE